MTRLYYTIFNLLALAAIIYIGVDTYNRVVRPQLGQEKTGKITSQDIPVKGKHVKPLLTDFQVIIDRNIFGSLEKASKEADRPEIESLETTSLKIALLGTVTGDQESAVAVIEETSKRKQGLYSVGDSVQDAIIKRILRGKVVLRVGDKDEILTMEESSSSKIEKVDKPPKSTGLQRTISVRRSDVDRSLKDLDSLLSQARIRPHFTDGQADGLTITGIKSGSFFRKMDLTNGDIIHAINGREIKTPDDIPSMYNDLKSGSNISLQIKRKGKLRTLNYRFR